MAWVIIRLEMLGWPWVIDHFLHHRLQLHASAQYTAWRASCEVVIAPLLANQHRALTEPSYLSYLRPLRIDFWDRSLGPS